MLVVVVGGMGLCVQAGVVKGAVSGELRKKRKREEMKAGELERGESRRKWI